MKERKQQYSNFTFVIIKQVVSDEEFKQLAKIVDNLVPLSVSYMQLGSNNAKNLVLCYVQLAKGKHVLKKRMRIALSCLVNKVYAVEASNVGLTLGRLYKQMELIMKKLASTGSLMHITPSHTGPRDLGVISFGLLCMLCIFPMCTPLCIHVLMLLWL